MPDVRVADARPYVQYACDGVQTVFTYPFLILAADDLVLVLDDGTTPTGVTVRGVGNEAGGRVTCATPPAAGRTLTLFRDMAITRTTDFLEAGEFRASAINAELDRLTMLLQQLEALTGQALKRAPEDADTALILPPADARADAVLGFDAAGRPSVVTGSARAAAQAADSAHSAGQSERVAAASATSAASGAAVAQQAAASAHAWAAKAAQASMAAERRRADLVAVRARVAARVPSVAVMPVFGLDATLGAGADALSVIRSGTAHVTDAKGQLVPVPANTPRFDHDPATGEPLGLLCEGARTNLLHDSFNPATQTRTLAPGTYTLSVRGGGTCTLSGGPSGTARQGTPVTFTLTTSRAVTFTMAGAPTAVQCEAGASATSPIATPPSGPASRAADLITLDDTAWYDPAGMSFVIEAHLSDVPATGILRLFSLDDGTDANRHDLYYAGDQTRVMLFAKSGGPARAISMACSPAGLTGRHTPSASRLAAVRGPCSSTARRPQPTASPSRLGQRPFGSVATMPTRLGRDTSVGCSLIHVAWRMARCARSPPEPRAATSLHDPPWPRGPSGDRFERGHPTFAAAAARNPAWDRRTGAPGLPGPHRQPTAGGRGRQGVHRAAKRGQGGAGASGRVDQAAALGGSRRQCRIGG
ncbi:hypothetical protein [Rhodovibrio salinarum]|uniref:hypothetical protein n=1 Tax=Rhodovibrio salinarum TaxID=1087 RepID=UPI0004AE13AB|nr:hypothetical protein [Rhodovibrio salinarum]